MKDTVYLNGLFEKVIVDEFNDTLKEIIRDEAKKRIKVFMGKYIEGAIKDLIDKEMIEEVTSEPIAIRGLYDNNVKKRQEKMKK